MIFAGKLLEDSSTLFDFSRIEYCTHGARRSKQIFVMSFTGKIFAGKLLDDGRFGFTFQIFVKTFTGKIFAGKPLNDGRIQFDFQKRYSAPRERGDIQIFVKTLTGRSSPAPSLEVWRCSAT